MHREPTNAEQEAIDNWLDSEEAEHYEFMDNQRIAQLDNIQDLNAFDDAEARGCCGCATIELTTSDGIKFLYGFNHGH